MFSNAGFLIRLLVALVGMAAIPLLGADPGSGRRVYQEACAHCHGADGEGWVNLASPISPNSVKQLRAEAENRKGLPWTLAELEAAEKTGAASEPPDR
jgi:mono/diheme cytochrome c family protein